MEKINEINGAENIYDYDARILDSRLGRWFSLDPLQIKFPFASPYNFALKKPLLFVDYDGRDIISTNQFNNSGYASVFCKIVTHLEQLPTAKRYIAPFLATDKLIILQYHNVDDYASKANYALTDLMHQTFVDAKKWDIKLPINNNYTIAFNSNRVFSLSTDQPSGSGRMWGQQFSEIGMVMTIFHEFQHASGAHHAQVASNKDYRDEMKQMLTEYFGGKLSSSQLEDLSWLGLDETPEFKAKIGEPGSDPYKEWDDKVTALLYDGCSPQPAKDGQINNKNEKLATKITPEECSNE
jgi:hypothetical protein